MFGGGLFSTIMKRSKMDDDQQLMEAAKTDFKRFQRELEEVNIPLDLRIEVGSFLLQISSLMDLWQIILFSQKFQKPKNRCLMQLSELNGF